MMSTVETHGDVVKRRAGRAAPLTVEVEGSEELTSIAVEVVAVILFRAWKRSIETELPSAVSMELRQAA